MAQPPPSRPTAAAAMRSFRARAAGIIAHERGFTPQCRAKLDRIAKELGLSDEQRDEALRSLRERTQAKDTDPIIEKFRQRLRKDLSGRHRTVIGPEIEARVVESAKRKYGLDESTVQGVLAEVAEELGLRHITGDQAAQLYINVVEQAVGEATWLARSAWDRLRAAGEKWGISFEEADELIEQKIAANRREQASGRLWNRLIIGGAVVAVVLTAATLIGLSMRHRLQDSPATAGKTSAVDKTSGNERKRAPAQPAWWDVDLALAMATARRELPGGADLYDMLRSESGAVRRTAYAQLTDLALKLDPQETERQVIIDMLSGCHGLDPDEACAAVIRDDLLALVPASDQELPATAAPIERAYWAVETAMTLLDRQGMPAARAEALAGEISRVLGALVSAGGPLESSRKSALAALTQMLYGQLTARGAAQPEAAAALLPDLTARASLFLSPTEIEQLNATFLVAVLTGAEHAWKTFEPLMSELAASREPLIVLDLLNVYRKAQDKALQATLGKLLVRRTGAKPRSDDPRHVARAVRQALGASGVSVSQSIEERWEDLQAAADPMLAKTSATLADRELLLVQTAQLAELATQALALAQGESGIAVYDELTREDEPETESSSDSSSSSADAEEAAPRGRLPRLPKRELTSGEETQLARSFGLLTHFERESPVVRANALRILAARVPHVADVSYAQGTLVARYLLSEKSDEELESTLGAIEMLGAWKQVRLAVADRLEDSKLTPRQRSQVLGQLLRSDAVPADASPNVLRRMLLADVLADLEAESSDVASNSAGGEAAAASQQTLAETYRQRARVLAVPSAEYQAAESPGQALELVVRSLGRRLEASSPSDPEDHATASHLHRMETVRLLASDDPQRCVLLQRIVLELLSRRIAAERPLSAPSAERIVADLAAADAVDSDLLTQLHAGERATLAMGMLYAVP